MNKLKIFFSQGKIPREWVIHLFSWAFLFVFPFMLMNRGSEDLGSREWIKMMGAPLTLSIVFYGNYLFWVPKYLLAHRKKEFILANLGTFIVAFLFTRFWFTLMDTLYPIRPHHMHRVLEWSDKVLFCIRELVHYIFATALAAITRMSQQWQHAEMARQDAELKRAEAELQNLRSQINPHFLLNTLNNIYALIAFNQEKAQNAVLDLSKLLRHVLYDNEQQFVSLKKECDFLNNYISLMRIRLSKEVDVQFHIDLFQNQDLPIAPLIFISLIENAFKHGISPMEKSFIHISLRTDERHTIYFRTENSNFPKKKNDVSGSGIGLEQVKRRLLLMYPNHHEWKQYTDAANNTYISELTIYTE